MKRELSILFILIVIALIILILFVVLYKVSWRFSDNVKIIKRIGLSNISLSLYRNNKAISYMSNGILIKGDISKIDNDRRKPAILLLHGSSPWGRKLGLYRLLAKEFALKGYLVLTIDVRGFGESEDPTSLIDLNIIDESIDVSNAINYLTTLNDVDQNQIYIIGHSWGGGLAIKVGVQEKKVRKIVAIGPPRRVTERMKTEYHYFQARYSHDRKIKGTIPIKVFTEYFSSLSIDNYLDYFSNLNHKPIFLIDGELEDSKDKLFLREIYKKMKNPKKYLTVSNTGHYLSTVNFSGTGLIFYDKRILYSVVNEIDLWLKE